MRPLAWSQHLALAWLALWCGLALLATAGFLALPDPNHVDLERLFAAPSGDAWLGRDELGRPLLSRLIIGAERLIQVNLLVVPLSAALGIALGLSAAWWGGYWEALVVYVIDVLLAFPGALASIALAASLGAGLHAVVIALAATSWVGFARLTHFLSVSLKQRDHVAAARTLGTGDTRILLQHVLPLMTGALKVEVLLCFAHACTAEATLAFLGLGLRPPEAAWGAMMRTGSSYLLTAPHLVLIPALALASVILALNTLAQSERSSPGRNA